MSVVNVKIKKINDIVIKQPSSNIKDERPPRCKEMFNDCYSNVFIVARKKSGKSTLISNMIKKIVGRDTHVIIFCSTIHKDAVWGSIKDWLKKNQIKHTSFLGITEGKVDHLKQFMSSLEQESLEKELDEDEDEDDLKNEDVKKPKKYFSDDEQDEEDEEFEDMPEEEDENEDFRSVPYSKIKFVKKQTSVRRKEPFQTPEYLLILDDISNELKNPTLEAWYKRSRHYKAFTISSTQYINDVRPASLRQQDAVLCFKGLDLPKLKKLYTDADITNIPFETFCDMYHNATETPYSFFYIGVRNDQFRKNFDKLYIVDV
jgi:hypothetical protein